MDNTKNKRGLHPIWFLIFLSIITIFLSFILSLLKLQGTEYSVSQTGKITSTILTVRSLISSQGFKFLFGENINNLLKFIPFGTVIIGLTGVGTMIKTGLLKEICIRLKRHIPRIVMFFIFSLLCIIMGFSEDLAFVIMIPISVVLFTEYRRSQVVGMTLAFVSVAAGANINLFITSLDYSLIEIAKNSVRIIDPDYSYGYSGDIYFIVVATLLLALLISIISEFISRKLPVRIEEEEVQIDDNLKSKGLKYSIIFLFIMGIIFVYSIIPNLPLSGKLLDNTQDLYVNKLFGANSPFVNGILVIISLACLICGVIYGMTTKQIRNNKDLIKILISNLNNIGEILLILLFASEFIAIFKYSKIGEVVSAILFDFIKQGNFSFVILILLSFIFIMISSLFLTSNATKWTMFTSATMSSFMKSNITPEFVGCIYRLSSSISNIITPLFPYFALYLGFIGLYSKNDFSINKAYNLISPYFIGILILWLFLIFAWYILGLPIGPKIFPTI